MKKLFILLVIGAINSVAIAGEAILTWEPSVSPGVTNYRVYWGTASRFYTRSNDVGLALSATVTGLVNTLRYYFAVTAWNDLGVESEFSDEVSAVIPPLPAPEWLEILHRPQLALGWSYPVSSDTLSGFFVYQKAMGAKSVKSWQVFGGASRSLDLPALLPGADYEFWVRAFTRYQPEGQLRYRTLVFASSERLRYSEPLIPYSGPPQVWPPEIMEAGGARLSFFGPAGRSNAVWASPDLRSWVFLGAAVEVVSGQYQFIDGFDSVKRFYQIR